MAEDDPTKAYVDAIANIKDTAKWFIASFGAVLAVMLGGIQLNAFGFSYPSGIKLPVWGSLIFTIGAVVWSLYLAVDVLVSEGVSLDQLRNEPAFASIRAFINRQWSYLPSKKGDPFDDLVQEFEKLGKKRTASGLSQSEEEEFNDCVTHLKVAVYIARWRQTLDRFVWLRNSTLLLVPVASISAAIMASAAQPSRESGKALDKPIEAALPATPDNIATLTAGGWTSVCASTASIPILIYKEYLPGVAEAATYPNVGCKQLHLVVMDRARILKVL
jgi:hypothetical protein